MKVNGKEQTTIWVAKDGQTVQIIDQTRLPHDFVILDLNTLEDAIYAIVSMQVRGAPLIGVAGAYRIALAMLADCSDDALDDAYHILMATRPTAVNLRWALDQIYKHLKAYPADERLGEAYAFAGRIRQVELDTAYQIGEHGQGLIKKGYNILTHCNAGWLATVDWGTALAPIYRAHEAGIPLHVWVDETRPRNQGASLTAWELGQAGVPHTVIADNVGGHLMQHGQVDLCIVGADRVTADGDAANKIGTYLKALAAHDNKVPFYVAMPASTIDWTIKDGVSEITIEERDGAELTDMSGRLPDGSVATVRITPEGSPAKNYGFDVTPSRLITGFITERGVCPANSEGLRELFPEMDVVKSPSP